jgi:phosphate/sulfate permease
MNINWIIIGIVVICCLALVYFLIKRNLKDEKEYEEFLSKTEETKNLNESNREDL